jgi:hypothetical protein
MAFNGSGVFSRLYSWTADAAAGIKIRADRMDNEMNGFATGLSNCVTKDGQTTVTADLPMSGYKHTGVDSADASDQYATYGQISTGAGVYRATVGGTANAITLSSTVPISAYTAGMMVSWIVGSSNTGATTVNIDAIGAKNLTKRGSSALSSGDLPAGVLAVAVYDGTQLQLVSVRVIKTDDIGGDQVTYAKIQNVSATDKILGRSTAGAGEIQEITCTAAGRAILDDADAAAQRATLGVIAPYEVGSTTQSTGSTVIPNDDTIPQVTEGDEYLTATYTPKSATSTLLIDVIAFTSHSVGDCQIAAALFKDGAADAIAAGVSYVSAAKMLPVLVRHSMTSGGTSAITFTVRIGGSVAGTTYFNRSSGVATLLGGVIRSSIRIQEIL